MFELTTLYATLEETKLWSHIFSKRLKRPNLAYHSSLGNSNFILVLSDEISIKFDDEPTLKLVYSKRLIER